MINTMIIYFYLETIIYDSDIEMFRGEFTFRHGGADFYATDLDSLRKEGKISLQVFHEMCLEDGIDPQQEYLEEFKRRILPKLPTTMVTSPLSYPALGQ